MGPEFGVPPFNWGKPLRSGRGSHLRETKKQLKHWKMICVFLFFWGGFKTKSPFQIFGALLLLWSFPRIYLGIFDL